MLFKIIAIWWIDDLDQVSEFEINDVNCDKIEEQNRNQKF